MSTCPTICQKTFIQQVEAGVCDLSNCSTKAAFIVPSSAEPENDPWPYASEFCYVLVTHFDAAYTKTYFSKYDPSTNTLVLKATLNFYMYNSPVYDSTAKLFVACWGTTIYTFDPATEVLSTHTSPTPGNPMDLVYVPQKSKTYCVVDRTGIGNVDLQFGYIDLVAFNYVVLGVIAGFGPANQPYNLAYSPVSNSLYGPWITGLTSGISKFNLTSNTGVLQCDGVISGTNMFWDPDRSLMILAYGATLRDFDTSVDLVAATYNTLANQSWRWTWMYDHDTTTLWGTGLNTDTGYSAIMNFNTTTHAFGYGLQDLSYNSLTQLSALSAIANAEDLAETQTIVRRLCLAIVP